MPNRCGASQNPQVFRVISLRPSGIFFPIVLLSVCLFCYFPIQCFLSYSFLKLFLSFFSVFFFLFFVFVFLFLFLFFAPMVGLVAFFLKMAN